MKENSLLKLIEKKLFTVHKSYNENSNFLQKEELSGLCKHEILLEKVHKELKSENSDTDLDVFDRNLQVFRDSGKDFSELYTFVFKEKTFISQNNIENFILKRKLTSSEDFSPVLKKLAEKSGDDSWYEINKCLYDNHDVLKEEAVKQIVEGIALKKITLYSRFLEAAESFASFVNEIWICHDFTHIYNLCKTNEKFVFILMYPYLLKPLGRLIWPTLLPHFHFISGSFTYLIQKVSAILKRGTALGHIYKTLYVKTSAKVVIGGVGLLALFSSYFAEKTNQALAKNVKLYKGLEGSLGLGFAILRLEGSKIIYEMTKTLSAFSNAAIVGALEPKQEVIEKALESPAVENLIKKIKE